jgi:hypothetical protein
MAKPTVFTQIPKVIVCTAVEYGEKILLSPYTSLSCLINGFKGTIPDYCNKISRNPQDKNQFARAVWRNLAKIIIKSIAINH